MVGDKELNQLNRYACISFFPDEITNPSNNVLNPHLVIEEFNINVNHVTFLLF